MVNVQSLYWLDSTYFYEGTKYTEPNLKRNSAFVWLFLCPNASARQIVPPDLKSIQSDKEP